MQGLHDRKAAELIIGYGESLAKAMDLPDGFAITHGWERLVEHARTLRQQLTSMSAAWMSMPDDEIAKCVAAHQARKAKEANHAQP